MNNKHGHTTHLSSSSTYKSWHMMKQRCLNPNYSQYNDYGGRGITVCKRWYMFENFLADMGERPLDTSLERINNNKGYSSSNCRWANKNEQQRNRRNNRLITFRGVTKCLSDWADDLGLKQHSLSMRMDVYGWTIEKALTTPAINSGRRRKNS